MAVMVPVYAGYDDLLGAPAEGHVKFTARPDAVYDSDTMRFISGQSRTVPLAGDGDLATELPAGNDPALSPVGWSYVVREWINGEWLRPAFDILVPAEAADDGVNLGAVAPVSASVGAVSGFVTLTTFEVLEDRVDVVEDDLTAGAAGLAAEITARAAADTAEATARAAADSAEATARADGDASTLAAAVAASDPAGAAAAAQAAAIASANATSAAAYLRFAQAAAQPDLLIVGAITRDANGAATSAPVVWPDGAPGTYAATTVSAAFPGAVDAYTITYGSPVTRTYTQPTVTRDANGAVTVRPTIVVT